MAVRIQKAHRELQPARNYIFCKRKSREQWRPVDACKTKKCSSSCISFQTYTEPVERQPMASKALEADADRFLRSHGCGHLVGMQDLPRGSFRRR